RLFFYKYLSALPSVIWVCNQKTGDSFRRLLFSDYVMLYIKPVVSPKCYWKSIISVHRLRNSFSSGTFLVSWAAAAMGSHFCTYCFAVSLFLQKMSRYRSAVF